MSVPVPPRFALPLIRVVLAVLALVSQLTLGSITEASRAEAAASAAIDASMLLCIPGQHLAPAGRPHRHPKGIVAAQTASLAIPAVLVPAAQRVPSAPAIVPGRAPNLFRPRAPPTAFTVFVRARAPPVRS